MFLGSHYCWQLGSIHRRVQYPISCMQTDPEPYIQIDMALVTRRYTCKGPIDLIPWILSTHHILHPVSHIQKNLIASHVLNVDIGHMVPFAVNRAFCL